MKVKQLDEMTKSMLRRGLKQVEKGMRIAVIRKTFHIISAMIDKSET